MALISINSVSIVSGSRIAALGLHTSSPSKRDAEQERRLVQIRADGGVSHPEVAIEPVRHANLRLDAKPAEFPSDAASRHKARRAAVAKLSGRAAVNAIELFAEGTTRAGSRTLDIEHTIESDARSEKRPRAAVEAINKRDRRLYTPHRDAGVRRPNFEAWILEEKVDPDTSSPPQMRFNVRAKRESLAGLSAHEWAYADPGADACRYSLSQ